VAVNFIGGNQSTRRNPRPVASHIIMFYRVYLTTLVVIGTDYTGDGKSNYHLPWPRRS